ncbi:MAG: hypothetical protein ACOC2W_01680 [bacterium]
MILDEIYLLTKHSNFSYKDLENLPTYKRRYFLHKLKNDIDQINEQNRRVSKGG